MKTNNRPMVKVVEYEFENISEFRAIKFMWTENKEILNSPKYYKETGNTREVERPMTDTEYIEYLEKKNKFDNRGWKLAIELNEKFEKNNQLLSKENQELNDLLASAYNKIDFELKDQFLKVVESVYWELMKGVRNNMDFYNGIFFDMLLQEIKSAM